MGSLSRLSLKGLIKTFDTGGGVPIDGGLASFGGDGESELKSLSAERSISVCL
jgi:hypothetical protein